MTPIEHSPAARAEFMMTVLRATRSRVLTLASEIDEIGVSLKHGMIDAETAATWCAHIGADAFMPTEINGGLLVIEGDPS